MFALLADSNTVYYLRRFRWIAPFLAVLSVLAAVWISLREYRSTVRIEVQLEYEACGGWPPRPLGSDEWFVVQHEASLHQSHEILAPVIEQFALTKRFSTKESPLSFLETKDRLARMIEVRGIRNTDMVEVSVYHRDPHLASGLANAIAESFNANSVRRRRDRVDRTLAQLDAEVSAQKARMEKARQELVESKDRGEIVDPDPDNSNSIVTGTDQTSILGYSVAKARYLNERKILEASEPNVRRHKQDSSRYDINQPEPIKIWQWAHPAQHRAHVDPRRAWEHHKLLCILGVIASLALIGLIAIKIAYEVMKIRMAVARNRPRGDTPAFDY